jgi:hypothetical protein
MTAPAPHFRTGAFVCLASPCLWLARFLFADEQQNPQKTRSEYMKTTTLTVAAAAIVMFAQSASAREHHHRHHRHHHHTAANHGGAYRRSGSGVTAYRGHDQRRPAAWCGWEMRRLVGSDPGPSYNLARNWAHWAGRGLPGSARLSYGRTTSERSSGGKTANGSSNPAMTAMPFALVRARLRRRSRSAGADCPI